MVRSTLKSVLPPLWLNEPHISITPTVPRFKDADNVRMAEVTELEINYWIRELELRKVVRKISHDAEATNSGYVYLGYTKKKSDIEVDGRVIENNPLVRQGQPFARRWPPRQVLLPPGFDELEDAPWVAIRFFMPLEDVRAKWPGEVTKDFKGNLKFDAADGTDQFGEWVKSEDASLVTIDNCWNKTDKKVYILADEGDDFLEEPKAWPYELEGFPLVRYSPEYVPDEYHATPPISHYMQQQKELNMTRTATAKRRKKTKSVIFMMSDLAESVGTQYKDAEDGEIISVPNEEGAEGDIRRKIVVDSGLPMDQGDLIYDGIMKDDIREQSGLGSERRGSGDPNVGSATASANIEKGVQVREADRGDGIKGLYLGVAKKLWMILKQFPNVERTRAVAGPIAGQFATVKYTLAELRGEFSFDMDFGAMLADTPAARATRATLNYNLLRADPLVSGERLVLEVLKSQNTPNPQDYLMTLRAPEQEHELILQGLPVEANERDEHERHLIAHDVQGERIDDLIQRTPEGPERMKLAMAQVLLIAHEQDHMRIVQEITGQQQGGGAGKPVAENLLRNQIRAGSSETEAELSGQPLTREGLVN
jgi:hypothetical protein